MKLKEIMNKIENLNELREELNIEKAYVYFYENYTQLYKDDSRTKDEFHTYDELVKRFNEMFIKEFKEELMKTEFVKSKYNNTMVADVHWKTWFGREYQTKCELFIDC